MTTSSGVRQCSTGAILESVRERQGHEYWPASIVFHPHLPLLATLDESTTQIRIWSVGAAEKVAVDVVRHTTAKIVLAGDSGCRQDRLRFEAG